MAKNLKQAVLLAVIVGVLVGSTVVYAAPAQRSTVPVHPYGDSSTNIPGSSSTLVRTDNGVSMTLHTSGLDAGAYTVWWVIFNDPSQCSGGECGVDDVLPPPGNVAAGVSVARATGNVVGGSGKGNFGAALSVGDTSEVLFGPGLTNPRGAEIHLIVRYHGEIIPGMVDEQLHDLNGGCPPNECADVQMALHLP
jgi:hypothetical protein